VPWDRKKERKSTVAHKDFHRLPNQILINLIVIQTAKIAAAAIRKISEL
jgi:hypothetical protein